MNQPNSHHFHAGKAARHAGKPCHISDARMSHTSRSEWYEGWNFQDALMLAPPSVEHVEQNENFFADLRAELRQKNAP
jgi:hypothetical protein